MIDVVMPQMGESIVEGTLTKWLKKPGERVERDEPLFEISTDKVDTEIPSPAAGTLSEVLVEEGETVAINTVVARIEDGGRRRRSARGSRSRPPPIGRSNAQAAPPAAAAGAGNAASSRAGRSGARGTRRTAPAHQRPSRRHRRNRPDRFLPLVRKMAREINIDLGQVKGTGAGGRITKQDVEAYTAQQQGAPHRRRPARRATACSRRRPARRATRCSSGRPAAAQPATPPAAPPASAPVPRRTAPDSHRADEHHAPEDRRAHGHSASAPRPTSPPCTRST